MSVIEISIYSKCVYTKNYEAAPLEKRQQEEDFTLL